jgi:hypothetical protein
MNVSLSDAFVEAGGVRTRLGHQQLAWRQAPSNDASHKRNATDATAMMMMVS